MPRGVAVVRGGLAPLVDDEAVRLHRRVEEDIYRCLGESWRDVPLERPAACHHDHTDHGAAGGHHIDGRGRSGRHHAHGALCEGAASHHQRQTEERRRGVGTRGAKHVGAHGAQHATHANMTAAALAARGGVGAVAGERGGHEGRIAQPALGRRTVDSAAGGRTDSVERAHLSS